VGRIERVGGGGRRLSLLGKDWGDWNPRESLLRLVNAERQVTITSGERYPD
jgi:hypothetical protein